MQGVARIDQTKIEATRFHTRPHFRNPAMKDAGQMPGTIAFSGALRLLERDRCARSLRAPTSMKKGEQREITRGSLRDAVFDHDVPDGIRDRARSGIARLDAVG